MPRSSLAFVLLTIILCRPAANGQTCTDWLTLPATPASSVQIGNLNVPGTQITVEAEFCCTTAYTGGPLYAGDLVSKHQDPSNVNYLLRPNEAEITTSDGYFETPPVCGIELNKTYQVCLTPGSLTFSEQGDHGPFNLTCTDCSQTSTTNNIYNGVPFPVQVQPTVPTTYTLLTETSTVDCRPVTTQAGITATINPNSCPLTDFAFSQDVCNPLSVVFTANSEPGISYSWNINGANETNSDPTNPSLIYTFTGYGTYPVILTATGSTCTGTIAKNIVIQAQPASLIITPDTVICHGKTIPLRTLSLLDFCWSPATGLDNPSSPTPNASPTATTTYHLIAKTTGANLVSNGNFENGNTGFTSAYQYDPDGTPAATYFVGTDPSTWNPGAPTGCGDHTTGNGNMMLVNGATDPGVNVWTSITMTVTPNTNYAFSVWIQSVSPLAPAILQFSINGTLLGSAINGSDTTCLWQQFYYSWNSGSQITATISLVNEQTAFSGNDFALDDISFAPVSIQADSIVITVDSSHVSASPLDTLVCPGMPVLLQAAGSTSYIWSPATGLSGTTIPNPTLHLPPSAAGSASAYLVTGISAAGCITDTTITISEYPSLITISPDTLICRGDAAQLYATGGGTYQWSPVALLNNPASPDPIARPVTSTQFQLTLIDINQCIEHDSMAVRIKPVPTFQAPPDQIVCIGFGVALKSDNPAGYIYAWAPGTSLDNPTAPYPIASPSADMTYTLRISDSLCASYDSSFSVTIAVKPSPTVNATAANINCAIHTTQLTASGALTYNWTPGTGLDNPYSPSPIAGIDATTTYIVKGTDSNGCYAFDTVTVKVTATGANTFVVPNAFTPNGDGRNDCFGVTHWGDVQLEEMQIYDRWGERVFSTRNPNDCWDGTFRGKPQPTGAYPYVIRAHTFCGEVFLKGTVMLVR